MLMYIFEKISLQQSERAVDGSSTITVADDNLLREYITSKDISKNLFQEGRIIIDFSPYRLLPSNVSLMKQPAGFAEAFSDVRLESGEHKGLLTFGTICKIPAFSYRYTIDVYGSDIVSFERHVQKHLSRLKQKAVGATAVILFVDESFSLERVDEVLQGYGAARSQNCPRHQLLFERQL